MDWASALGYLTSNFDLPPSDGEFGKVVRLYAWLGYFGASRTKLDAVYPPVSQIADSCHFGITKPTHRNLEEKTTMLLLTSPQEGDLQQFSAFNRPFHDQQSAKHVIIHGIVRKRSFVAGIGIER
jgi:hypothetical protein